MENSGKFYVDMAGNYLGVFVGCEPEVPSVEVQNYPENANQLWDFDNSVWLPYVEENPAP